MLPVDLATATDWLPEDAGTVLLPIARAAIAAEFGITTAVDTSADWLNRLAASFVTLTQNDRLRGCIGTVEAHQSLVEDVRANAVAVAFRDRRFPDLTEAELDRTTIEVTVLSPLHQLSFESEAEAIAGLRPGIDGVLLQHAGHRGTYLPQVWNTLPDSRAFLASLKTKAGLPAEFWDADVQLYRYTARSWQEPSPTQEE